MRDSALVNYFKQVENYNFGLFSVCARPAILREGNDKENHFLLSFVGHFVIDMSSLSVTIMG